MGRIFLRCLVVCVMSFVGRDVQAKSWAFLPVIASSTETGIQLGAFGAYFPPKNKNHPSSINLVGVGSLKGQYQLALAPDFYWDDNRYHLEGFVTWRKWPANHYGIGNDTPNVFSEYEARGMEVYLIPQRRYGDYFYIGPYLRLFWEDVEVEQQADFIGLRGVTGGRAVGLGVWAAYDRRDNPNAARRGIFARYTSILYRDLWGSDFGYQVQTFEARYYMPMAEQSVLALASYFRHADGRVPFRDLSTPDGSFIFRGIEKGRYRDRHILTLQSEFRFPVTGKWGGTVFAEVAQVASRLEDFSASRFKNSVGIGFRYALNPDQKFNLRVDTNWVDGAFGLTINAREAF